MHIFFNIFIFYVNKNKFGAFSPNQGLNINKLKQLLFQKLLLSIMFFSINFVPIVVDVCVLFILFFFILIYTYIYLNDVYCHFLCFVIVCNSIYIIINLFFQYIYFF